MKLFQWFGENKHLRKQLNLQERIAFLETRIANFERERADTHKIRAKELETAMSRARVVKVPERAMKQDELLDALNVEDDNPIWRAVHQLLDQGIVDATDAASERPKADPRSGVIAINAEVRTFHAGGVDHLREFQALLLDLQAKARRDDAAAEAKEGEE